RITSRRRQLRWGHYFCASAQRRHVRALRQQITSVERNKPIAFVVDSVHEVPCIAVRNPGLLEIGKQAFVDDLGNHGVRCHRTKPRVLLIPKTEDQVIVRNDLHFPSGLNENGVRCYSPAGELIGKIHIPETVANLCFGGQQRNRLYICGSTSLYAVYTSVQGALKP